MKKLKNELPGKVIVTPELRKLEKTNYLEFIKEYQRLLLKNLKVKS